MHHLKLDDTLTPGMINDSKVPRAEAELMPPQPGRIIHVPWDVTYNVMISLSHSSPFLSCKFQDFHDLLVVWR